MTDLNGKRITFKRTRPNPLFQSWLKELYEEAKAKKSKLEPMLNQAYTSICKYPLQLETGAECAILNGFDRRLCLFIDKRLEIYKNHVNCPEVDEQNFVASPTVPTSIQNLEVAQNHCNVDEQSTTNVEQDSDTQCSNIQENGNHNRVIKKPKSKQYKPGYKTGAYAILLGLLELLEEDINTPVKKEHLIERAQKYSEESFTRPKPETFYTAWSNITTLVKKGLVIRSSIKNASYSLSEQGLTLAKELFEDYKNRPSTSDVIFTRSPDENIKNNAENNVNLIANSSKNCNGINTPVTSSNIILQEPKLTIENLKLIEMEPGTFDVILLIDKHETSGLSKKNDPTVAQFKKYPNLNHEFRSLKVGDFTWIAKHKVNKDQELVLPFVVERKRMDDLGSSIKDGRFHEQKFRLRKCGLNNILYLVENYGSNKNVGLPVQSLMQALANTRVQDGFKVHITDSMTNSVRFLAMMTRRLTLEYEGKHLQGCESGIHSHLLMTFEQFNKSALKTKPLTVTDTFIKLLLQLKGVSVEKALAITNKYKTPSSLMKAYECCSIKERPMLLANLKYKNATKNVGPKVSKTLFQLFVPQN